MAKINITKTHKLSISEARQKLTEALAKDFESYGITLTWTDDNKGKMERSGTGASGTIDVTESEILISIDIVYALTPLKGIIQKRFEEALEQINKPSDEKKCELNEHKEVIS